MALRIGLRKPAAISDTAGHGKTRLLRLERKFRRGKHIPHDEGALEIRVSAITAVIGQAQLAAGKVADHQHALEPPLQALRQPRLLETLCNGTGAMQQSKLARNGLRVIVYGRATAVRTIHEMSSLMS